MNISKTSWHYQMLLEKPFGVIKDCYYEPSQISNSLCLYFWQVIFALFVRFLISYIVISPFIFLTVIFFTPPTSLYSFGWNILIGISSLLGGAVISFLVLFICVFIVITIPEILPKYKSKGLLLRFLKSKVDKVCPTIKFL